MNCPRCESTVLEEKDREGILVDGCPKCRGVWLDRGELEKLIQRSLAEIERAEGTPLPDRRGGERPDQRLRGERRPDDRRYDERRRDDDDDDDRHEHHPRRRRGFLESFGDIFD